MSKLPHPPFAFQTPILPHPNVCYNWHFHKDWHYISKYSFCCRELNLWFAKSHFLLSTWESKSHFVDIKIAFQKLWQYSSMHLISNYRVQAPKKGSEHFTLKGKICLKETTWWYITKNDQTFDMLPFLFWCCTTCIILLTYVCQTFFQSQSWDGSQ